MKKIIIFFCSLFTIGHLSILPAQNVTELQKPELSKWYVDVMKKVEAIHYQNPEEAVKILKKALLKIEDPFERFNIIFWKLSFLYAETGQMQECYDILKLGQGEGFYYPFRIEERKFPPYVEKLQVKKLQNEVVL